MLFAMSVIIGVGQEVPAAQGEWGVVVLRIHLMRTGECRGNPEILEKAISLRQ